MDADQTIDFFWLALTVALLVTSGARADGFHRAAGKHSVHLQAAGEQRGVPHTLHYIYITNNDRWMFGSTGLN